MGNSQKKNKSSPDEEPVAGSGGAGRVTKKSEQKAAKAFQKQKASKDSIVKKIRLAHKTRNLNLENCKLKSFPKEALAVQNLKILDLGKNALEALPDEFPDAFPELQNLFLNNNSLKGLPRNMIKLLKLEDLQCSNNKLVSEHMHDIPYNLRNLTLRFNSLATFPPNLDNVMKLVTLDLSHNHLTGNVPGWLFQLPQLESLQLAYNQLAGIDAELSESPKLQTLNLEGNLIESNGIPQKILKDSKISILNLKKNLITKSELMALDGFKEFDIRRQAQLNKAISAGLTADTSVCGLD